jgi:hypothetical protein
MGNLASANDKAIRRLIDFWLDLVWEAIRKGSAFSTGA